MDSTAQTAPRDSEIINELRSHVTNGFDSPNSLRDSEIINELLSHVTNEFDSPNSLRDSEIINELQSRVTHGFDSPNSPYGLIKHQRTAVKCDSWIRQPTHPIGIQK
jgi:hypothetical protein